MSAYALQRPKNTQSQMDQGVIYNLNPITAAGSMAINRVFEGEPDHLIPSVSEELLDNNMFTVAGRMIGHSFLHNGPSFPGLSPAIIHVLFGGSPETAPVTIRDCPDLDIREIVEKVSRDKKRRPPFFTSAELKHV